MDYIYTQKKKSTTEFGIVLLWIFLFLSSSVCELSLFIFHEKENFLSKLILIEFLKNYANIIGDDGKAFNFYHFHFEHFCLLLPFFWPFELKYLFDLIFLTLLIILTFFMFREKTNS